ncbi:MAG: UDP-2,3-diacylglucosamine diphosphatase LpxG [Chlamydiales bacterium]
MRKSKWVDWVWDSWCILSLIGIWPRFIEPRLLSTTCLTLPIAQLPIDLAGLTILQFSDLHWNSNFPPSLARKLVKKINSLKPDLIVFTGDFLCRSTLQSPLELQTFLSSLKAKVGCYAVLGNHDYESYVTAGEEGDYDIEQFKKANPLTKGLKRFFFSPPLSGKVSLAARQVGMHSELIHLLQKTPFQLIHNETKIISYKGSRINLCGLGEHTLARCLPQEAFKNYHTKFPGIVLTHNPDALPELLKFPGDLVLAGHTHGAQINLPLIWDKLTRIEQMELIRGVRKIGHKWVYINRGIGGTIPFRWFSIPELTMITLKRGEAGHDSI